MINKTFSALLICAFLGACAHTGTQQSEVVHFAELERQPSGVSQPNELGAIYDSQAQDLSFRIFSSRATRIEIYLYKKAFGEKEVSHFALSPDPQTHIWSIKFSKQKIQDLGLSQNIFYGFRIWGPNWPYDTAWTPGSLVGFKNDVDSEGNRFNPNKLLLDPYAREVSHDPLNPRNSDFTYFQSGSGLRNRDSGLFAPKGVVLWNVFPDSNSRIPRALKDEIIYEVQLRGLTKSDPTIPESLRGTFKGAALKARYLKQLGITAIEFLPVQETQNDLNATQKSTEGVNYWGYMTMNYFSPDRHFAFDQSPGGPTKEFREMTEAFHNAGIKVYLDMVYNHTFEGGLGNDITKADVLSYRGIDNATYYLLTADHLHYWENTGTGNNLNTAHPVVRDLIVDSLKYWKNQMGVDGFRFDLAPVLGNSISLNGFNFDGANLSNAINRMVKELPGRPAPGGEGVDLIAEPWTTGSYHLGQFPWGWAEWNGSFRDTLRKFQNKEGFENISPGQLAKKFVGSSEIFQASRRKPWHSINFMDVHDGFTLADLYRYNQKNNLRSWPDGPSDGGTDNNDSWDQGGDLILQRQAARNGMAFLMLSAGVPMIQGGDEFLRTLKGNNNSYNLDTAKNWLNWDLVKENSEFFNFTQRLIAFRRAHSSLRPTEYFSGQDHNGNGLKDITWYMANGAEPSADYWNNSRNRFLAYRIDTTEFQGETVRSIYVAINGSNFDISAKLPTPNPNKSWYRVSDTAAWNEKNSNISPAGSESLLTETNYLMHGRSVLLLIEK